MDLIRSSCDNVKIYMIFFPHTHTAVQTIPVCQTVDPMCAMRAICLDIDTLICAMNDRAYDALVNRGQHDRKCATY